MSSVALAVDVAPTIVSPSINLSCAEIKSLSLLKSSTRTVAVAPDVEPVMVSPFSNLP